MFPRCPKCDTETMVAILKGKISMSSSYSIRINHTLLGKDYFYLYTKVNEYDKNSNNLTITIDIEKLKTEIMKKIERQCFIQNTEIPSLKIKLSE